MLMIFEVVAVQGLRKEFKTNEGAKSKKSCFKKADDAKEEKIKVAVRNLSLGVEEGEVFGLLGHNGAGKTTTMKIIIAEEAPTCGNVRIGEYKVDSNMSKGFELLGYCPQVGYTLHIIYLEQGWGSYFENVTELSCPVTKLLIN